MESIQNSGDIIQLSPLQNEVSVKSPDQSIASDIRFKKGNLIFVDDNMVLGINGDEIEAHEVHDAKEESHIWIAEQVNTDTTETTFISNSIDSKPLVGTWPFDCDKVIPCNELPMQTCGCDHFKNDANLEKMGIVYNIDANSETASKIDFQSCEELKYHGVYISGYFMINGLKTYCNSLSKRINIINSNMQHKTY